MTSQTSGTQTRTTGDAAAFMLSRPGRPPLEAWRKTGRLPGQRAAWTPAPGCRPTLQRRRSRSLPRPAHGRWQTRARPSPGRLRIAAPARQRTSWRASARRRLAARCAFRASWRGIYRAVLAEPTAHRLLDLGIRHRDGAGPPYRAQQPGFHLRGEADPGDTS